MEKQEGHALIDRMIAEKQLRGWSKYDLEVYIGKPFNIDEKGNVILAGTGVYTQAEQEAISICAAMEVGTPRF